MHITSLPGPHGIGDLGAGARNFVHFLKDAGLSLWQVLPIVPAGAGDSPYSSWSAFAGNPWMISLEDLANVGLLDQADLEGFVTTDPNKVDFNAVRAFKGPRLEKAADRLLHGRHPLLEQFLAFKRQSPWAEEAGLFQALADKEQKPWWEWSNKLRAYDQDAVKFALGGLRKSVDEAVAIQFFFDMQWKALREECKKCGISLIGDLPIYVDANSVDVWTHQNMFQLDEQGMRVNVAGVPPDAFSEDGQFWGNPLYNWDALKASGYQWWIDRIKRAFELYDTVRIDHFRAFSAYWSVPATASSAKEGQWIEGPGAEFFEFVESKLGKLSVIAEDLGVIDDGVRNLLASTGFPGMKILQFAFGGENDNLYLPHNHIPHSVVYTGTHDNDTTLGWWFAASPFVQDHVRRYFARDGHDLVWDMIRTALGSVAETAILPVQDILCLDNSARMNTPSVCSGNWAWRMQEGALQSYHATRLRELCNLFQRA